MNNKLNDIYIATFSGQAEEVAKKYGFGIELNDLCISSNLEPEKRTWVVDRMREELSGAGAMERKTIMHGPFTELTPAAIDSRAIDLMKSRYVSTIEICVEMGIKDLVLHDGYIPLIYQKPWHLKRSILFWKEFARNVLLGDKLSVPKDFRIYIENVFDDEPDLLLDIINTVNDDLAKEFSLKQGEEKFLICLDVGHANAVGDAPVTDWIERMGRTIGHFHLHNNDGTGDNHDDIDCGTFDIDEVLSAISECCMPDVTMTIESRQAEPSAKYLYEYYSR